MGPVTGRGAHYWHICSANNCQIRDRASLVLWRAEAPSLSRPLKPSAVRRPALFRLLRLLGSFAFFDDFLLRLARHFFVVAEGFHVHAPSAGQ